jgi:hypothetical protein
VVETPFRVEFFYVGTTPDPSGRGEAADFICADSVLLGVIARSVVCSATTPGGTTLADGDRITATATNGLAGGADDPAPELASTSEFAANVTIQELSSPGQWWSFLRRWEVW